jgi:hypothetical protein
MNNYYDLFKNYKLNEKYKIIIIDKMFYLKLPINYDFQMLQIRKITLFDRKLLNNKDSNRYKSYIYRPVFNNKTSKKVKIDKSKLFYISKINIVFNLHRGISNKISKNQSIKRKRNFFSNTDKNKIICQSDSNVSISEKFDSKLENNKFLPVLQQNKK